MTRGKYSERADSRLRVLESDALREAHATIRDLKTQLGDAKHDLDVAQAQTSAKAMQAAAHLSGREKQNLRNRIASLEHQASEERIRNAVLTWELMHRHKFDQPSPAKILSNETPESYRYWCDVHWQIGALFISDYDELWRFFRIAEGYAWGMAGGNVSGPTGESIRLTARESKRILHKGRLKDHMLKRVRRLRAYYDRIWRARQAGGVEPISPWKDDDRDVPDDVRDRLVQNAFISPVSGDHEHVDE